MNVIIKNGRVNLIDSKGSIINQICGNNPTQASLSNNEKNIVVTFKEGKVLVYDLKGHICGTITNNDGVSAIFSGNDVVLSKKNGKSELRKINGSIIRTL